MFAKIKFQTSLKMGDVGHQVKEKPCVHSRGHIFSPILMKLGQMFAAMKSQMSLKSCHVGSKTRSPCQIIENTCIRSRGLIFGSILMKLTMFTLMKSQTSLKMGYLGHILVVEKNCVRCRGHIFSQILMILGQNICLDEMLDKFENGSCWVKNYVGRSNHRRSYSCNQGVVI